MSDLARLEIALRRDCDYARLTQSHVHRATREDSVGIIKGRDAITAAWVDQAAAECTITADFDTMIAYTVNGWHGHRWVWREAGKIIREIVVEDRGVPVDAPPEHAPLGELRAGTGQFGAGETAILPAGFPADAHALANQLHHAWNGRAFNCYDGPWLPPLVRTLRDATFYFEHAAVASGQIALLWRVHGHHASGRRIRLIGSSVFRGDEDETVIDHAAMAAQSQRETLSYA